MRGYHFADLLDGFDDGMTEFLVLKMCPHSIDNALPELVAALLVNRFIADDGELVRARRDEN